MNDRKRKKPTMNLLKVNSRAAERDGASKERRANVASIREVTGPELVVFAGLDEWGCAAMAAAWFPMLADPRKARAVVAGGSMSRTLEAQVSAALRESGADLRAVQTVPLTAALLRNADLVVTMDESFARGLLMTRGHEIQVPVHREHWMVAPESVAFTDTDVSDAQTQTRGLRDLVRSRVAMLVFTEGWSRADLSREMARVTRSRPHSAATI